MYAAAPASSFRARGGAIPHAGDIVIYGHGASSSRWIPALALVGLFPLAACDVEWGGATLAFINPAPTPDPAEQATSAVELVAPLPAGDLLYLVHLGSDATGDGAAGDGTVRALPIARMVDGAPVELGLPESIDDAYRARFDSVFYATGTELPLHAGGHRIGTLVLGEGAGAGASGCLSIGTGQVLLPRDSNAPEFAFAWAGEGAFDAPATYDLTDTDARMRTFGPVLTEELLRRGGETRPQLARRVAMRAVPWPGDERPAMAATYLVNDDLGPDPPRNSASSLFFLARFDGRQYVPEWWEVRRYEGGEGREAFVYFGAIAGPDGRIDFATRHDGSAPRLTASVDRADEDRRIDWVEPPGCPAVSRLGQGPSTPATGG